MDVDWLAGRLRVRRAYVRGEYGTTKSRRGFRAVPLADRVAAELEALSRRSAFTADDDLVFGYPLTNDDLVFGYPLTGTPLDRSKVRKRFKAAIRSARVRDVRFRDLRHTSEPGRPRSARRCGPCRSGWGTRTSPRR